MPTPFRGSGGVPAEQPWQVVAGPSGSLGCRGIAAGPAAAAHPAALLCSRSDNHRQYLEAGFGMRNGCP